MISNHHGIKASQQDELQLFKIALSGVTELVVITAMGVTGSEQNLITFVNKAFELKTGLCGEQILGLPSTIFHQSDADLKQINTLPLGAQDNFPLTIKLRIPQASKEGCWMSFEIVPVRNPQGRYSHCIWRGREIQGQQILRPKPEQNLSVNPVKLLAAGVAHEVNNILAIIMGNAGILQDMLESESPYLKLVESITRTSDKAVNLTQSLLLIAEQQVLRPTEMDVNQLVMDLQGELHEALGLQHQLNLSLKMGLWLTSADEKYLKMTLLNLLDNASEALSGSIPTGAGALNLLTSNTRIENPGDYPYPGVAPGEYIKLELSDNGCGMSDEISKHIFKPFFKSTELRGLKGLGLSEIYGFIKQSGGYCFVYSKPGMGSTFTLLLKRYYPGDKQSLR